MLYNDDAPSVEVGVLVGASFAPVGRVVPSRLPGGTVVTAVHRGPYSELGRTYEAVHAGAAARGLALAGPRWEIYGHPPEVEIEVCWLARRSTRKAAPPPANRGGAASRRPTDGCRSLGDWSG